MPKEPRKKSTSKKYESRKAAAKKVTAIKKGAKKAAPKKPASRTPSTAHPPVPQVAAAGKRITFSQVTDTDLARVKQRVQADPRLAGMFGFINTFLEASEYQVIKMMGHSNVWINPPIPPNPHPGVDGAVEFGLLDYWINNPGNNKYLLWLKNKFWPKVIRSPLPKTLINSANYQALLKAVAPGQPGIVAGDGTWYNQGKFGQLDPEWWNEALVDYILTYSLGLFAPFAQTPATVTLSGADPNQVSIALVGDWGTGNYPGGPAASVINAITNLKTKPDYIIHLGDVYYAGSQAEEQSNLLGMWPAAYAGKSFTLNSNHEMYSGALGYYSALNSAQKIFSLQKGTSYFALQYGNPKQTGGPWTIIGLDSGYWSSSPMVMDGSIQATTGSGATAQPQFLQGLVKGGLSPQNAIVLTHHNPISTDGSKQVVDLFGTNLMAQVKAGLGDIPRAWYWGHVHNGIVYPNPTATGDNFYGRCAGHGALPFGNAWELAAAPAKQVQAYANTLRPSPNPANLMMNGFVLLTITQTGQVTETFYQQDGSQAPWVQPFTYPLGTAAAAAGEGSS